MISLEFCMMKPLRFHPPFLSNPTFPTFKTHPNPLDSFPRGQSRSFLSPSCFHHLYLAACHRTHFLSLLKYLLPQLLSFFVSSPPIIIMSHAPDSVDAPPKQPEADAVEVPALPVEKPHAPPEQQEGDTGKDESIAKVEKKKKKKKVKAPAHPPYFQMIKEAITALNEKGGSSPYAIAKHMEENHKHVLPSNFRKTLGLQLKHSVSKAKLIKIKASFKLSEPLNKSPATTTSTKTRAARANAAVKPDDGAGKKMKRKSREVSKIENPPSLPSFPTPRGRRSKRSAPPPKAKQLKSVKKTKRVAALATA